MDGAGAGWNEQTPKRFPADELELLRSVGKIDLEDELQEAPAVVGSVRVSVGGPVGDHGPLLGGRNQQGEDGNVKQSFAGNTQY